MKADSRKIFLETRARIIERARKESKSNSKSLKDMLFGCNPGNIKYYKIKKLDDTIEDTKDKNKEPLKKED